MIDPAKLEALDRAQGLSATPKNLLKVAKATNEEASRWAFEQWECRERAKAKFAQASEMLFVREALEQATHEEIAAWHAARFPHGVLVTDLTVGIGSDLIALARRGPAIGYELDPERAEIARHNLKVAGVEAEVRVQDCVPEMSKFEFAWADPARRIGGKRSINPTDFSPHPFVIAEVMASMELGGIKLSPMMSNSQLLRLSKFVDFISFKKECREAITWHGKLAGIPRPMLSNFTACHVETGDCTFGGDVHTIANRAELFFYEADPAAIRAGALDQLGGGMLAESYGYLTHDKFIDSVWLTPFRVLADFPADEHRARQALREHRVAKLEYKQRGTRVEFKVWQNRLQKYLADDGIFAYFAFYLVEKQLRMALIQRISKAP